MADSEDENASKPGFCSICQQSARLRCAGCQKRFYCTREHQREDWSGHKTSCRSWEIRESPELGKHLVATRDLEEGDLVLAESPILWGPTLHGDSIVCVGCGDSNVRAKCPGCDWYACVVACPGLVDENRHRPECSILAKLPIAPRCDILIVLRALMMRRTNPKHWKIFASLQSHEESRGPGTEAHDETELVARCLTPIFAVDSSLRQTLPKVCGIIEVNALETSPPEGNVAIYETACLLEHNCVANTRHSFSKDAKELPKITVMAATPIRRGEHITTMYTHALWPTRARQEHLQYTKYFSCRCDRCSDPTELGSHLGTLKCLCGSGLMFPNDPLDSETDWSCSRCPAVLSSSEVSQLMERFGTDVEIAMVNAGKNSLRDLLSRLNVLLHPGHQHCITVGHSLMQLLSPEDPQKAQICKRIIETTSILDPYGTRLVLYTVVALRELATCPGQNRTELLEKARSLLKYEPTEGPADELARLLDRELSI